MKREYENITKDITSFADFVMASGKNIEYMTVKEIMEEIYDK